MTGTRAGLLLTVIAGLAAGCGPAHAGREDPRMSVDAAVPADSTDMEVYSAVLRGVARGGADELLIQSQSENLMSVFNDAGEPGLPAHHRPRLPGLQPETERSFLEQDSTPVRLSPTLQLARPYRLIERNPRRDSGRRSGVYVLSRPGYNRDRTQALVYVVHACPLCGEGHYVVVARTHGGWRITVQSLDWIS